MKDKQTMKDKQRISKNKKGNWNNRSKNRSNKKFNKFVPTQEQRVDKELLQEVSVFLSLSKDIPDETICRHYGITDRQLQFIKKHQQKWDIWEILEEKELK